MPQRAPAERAEIQIAVAGDEAVEGMAGGVEWAVELVGSAVEDGVEVDSLLAHVEIVAAGADEFVVSVAGFYCVVAAAAGDDVAGDVADDVVVAVAEEDVFDVGFDTVAFVLARPAYSKMLYVSVHRDVPVTMRVYSVVLYVEEDRPTPA
jgi:hypothetical protein